MGSIEGTTIGEFLTALAAGTPEPGGGAAAALIAAAGAALLGMVCALSVERAQSDEGRETLRRVGLAAEELRTRALSLAVVDADSYRAVIRARRMPRATPDERTQRAVRVDEALKGAIQSPLDIAALSVRILRLAGDVSALVIQSAAGDLAAGMLAARTALEISLINASINLSLIQDPEYKGLKAEELQQYRSALLAVGDIVERVVLPAPPLAGATRDRPESSRCTSDDR